MKVSIYIDGANFYHGVKLINSKYTDTKFDFEKFITNITRKDELVKVNYYNAALKQELNGESYRRQQKFFERLRLLEKFKVIMCRRQKRTDVTGKEYHVIKGDDIHLAIDMLSDAYENKYDKSILISGDGDFAPLIRYVKRKNKLVENYYFEGNLSRALSNECDSSFIISKKILNKFFFRS